MVNGYLRPFPNYGEVQLLSTAILVRPELRVTFDASIIASKNKDWTRLI
jgi:hypothetical protein